MHSYWMSFMTKAGFAVVGLFFDFFFQLHYCLLGLFGIFSRYLHAITFWLSWCWVFDLGVSGVPKGLLRLVTVILVGLLWSSLVLFYCVPPSSLSFLSSNFLHFVRFLFWSLFSSCRFYAFMSQKQQFSARSAWVPSKIPAITAEIQGSVDQCAVLCPRRSGIFCQVWKIHSDKM